ncbi:MAG: hypothetical protein CME15_09220, partial [Gemmatimonadetes bacterium]|nr:hypothetical protein [Gemmatimonadota bacterium]
MPKSFDSPDKKEQFLGSYARAGAYIGSGVQFAATIIFCLFAGYFMLRPIRESMGIAAGVENLQWLFTATFFVMLAAVPLFAWLSSHVPRLHFVDWVYGFFCLNLLGF